MEEKDKGKRKEDEVMESGKLKGVKENGEREG